MQPQTRYARLGGDRIAYQVLGQGPPDLVVTGASLGHVDIVWEDPRAALFLRRLASACRLILVNRLGTGASDPLPSDPLPAWESFAQELATVLDELGCEQAAVLGEQDAGPTALFFAATRPERTSAVIVANAAARYLAAPDHPIGIPLEVAQALLAQFDQLWGSDAMAALLVPSRADDQRFCRWFAKLQRTGASPGLSRGSCAPSWRSTPGRSCR